MWISIESTTWTFHFWSDRKFPPSFLLCIYLYQSVTYENRWDYTRFIRTLWRSSLKYMYLYRSIYYSKQTISLSTRCNKPKLFLQMIFPEKSKDFSWIHIKYKYFWDSASLLSTKKEIKLFIIFLFWLGFFVV